MAVADLSEKSFSVTWCAEFNQAYQRNVVQPSVGMQSQRLRRNRPFGKKQSHSGPRKGDGTDFEFYKESLTVTNDGRWVLVRESPRPPLYSGFDGSNLWSRKGPEGHPQYHEVDRVSTLNGEPDSGFNYPEQCRWNAHVSSEFRMMLELRIVLGVMQIREIKHASENVCNLEVIPRNLDLISTSLLSPWAHSWKIQVDAHTGIVVEANSRLQDESIAVRHRLVNFHKSPDVSGADAWPLDYR